MVRHGECRGLQERMQAMEGRLRAMRRAWRARFVSIYSGVRKLAGEESAQGTTEYAILVGVLVVIAILAIIAFRDKVSELWDAIASGINSL